MNKHAEEYRKWNRENNSASTPVKVQLTRLFEVSKIK